MQNLPYIYCAVYLLTFFVTQTVELLIGFWLFQAQSEKDWDAVEDHLARMTEALEEQFPPDMLNKSEHRAKYFHDDGTRIQSAFYLFVTLDD